MFLAWPSQGKNFTKLLKYIFFLMQIKTDKMFEIDITAIKHAKGNVFIP